MKKSLSLKLCQVIFSWRLIVITVVGLLILIWYSIANWIQINNFLTGITYGEVCGDFLDAIYDAHARTGFSLFAPVFAVIPSVTLFCDDYNSGYLKSVLFRSNIERYIRENILTSTISGGLAVFLPEFICSLIFIIVGEPHVPSQYSSYLDATVFADLQYVGNGYLVLCFYLFFAFLFGAVWANIGMCISAFIPNRYVALSAPFAIYYGVHLLLNRSVTFSMFSPANMVQPTSKLLPNIAFPVAYQLTLLLLAIVLFANKLKRRVENV